MAAATIEVQDSMDQSVESPVRAMESPDRQPESVAPTQLAVVPLEEPEAAIMSPPKATRCCKCQMERDSLEMQIYTLPTKILAGKFICQGCNALTTMLRRRSLPDGWDICTQEEQTNFFRACLTQKGNQQFCFQKVRAAMKDTLMTANKRVMSTKVKGEFRPLAFWVSQGYDSNKVQQEAEQMPCPFAGTVYKINILSHSEQQIEEKVEQSLLHGQGDSEAKGSFLES